MVTSKKGKTGGYYLLQSPEQINIAEVVRLFEGAIALLPCVAHKYYERCEECKDEATCGIRDVFADVRNEKNNILKNATLAHIIQRSKALEEAVEKKL